ncbi:MULTISPECIES: hypothetical protein [Streptomyces]|uniref:Uncharacterized protein n=1 Tax=Streptomyces dengpaensis TaxID=2049881 RepID=A0ABN5I9Z9_9ACTN|nr:MULTISPECIES: hypothetical protein [Streptomyces]AVH60017.1 hypothetical protein C4B68_34265 [Streptomyces dengpaensis]PIB09655.1 hypothetical protein B1C81_10940 [Streptomyces sp. HG99]
MAQQISPEWALKAFRQRHGELADENILLKALVSELEAEIERLHNGEPDPHPTMTGPVAEQG